jgi:hypothetical protein
MGAGMHPSGWEWLGAVAVMTWLIAAPGQVASFGLPLAVAGVLARAGGES